MNGNGGIAILNQSVAQTQMAHLQAASKAVLAGQVEHTIVIVVTKSGQIQSSWTGSIVEVVGALELAKASAVRHAQGAK